MNKVHAHSTYLHSKTGAMKGKTGCNCKSVFLTSIPSAVTSSPLGPNAFSVLLSSSGSPCVFFFIFVSLAGLCETLLLTAGLPFRPRLVLAPALGLDTPMPRVVTMPFIQLSLFSSSLFFSLSSNGKPLQFLSFHVPAAWKNIQALKTGI